MRRSLSCGLCAGWLLLMAQLAGCASAVSSPDTAGSGSSVTTYGTVDGGIGRIGH